MRYVVVIGVSSQASALMAALVCGHVPGNNTVVSLEENKDSLKTAIEELVLVASPPDPCSFELNSVLHILNHGGCDKPDWGKHPKQNPRARVTRRGMHGVW